LIICRLQGGLGNQLFQYAAARSLATRLAKPFKLENITSLQKDTQRKIALHDLQTKFELATKEEVKEFLRFPSLYRHKYRLFKMGKHIYREPHFHYDENFFRLSDPVYLDGFWQSPLYFKNIETIIREEFTIGPEKIKNVVEKGRELEQRPSVAIHIRRGDFLKPATVAYHGVLSPFYYERAIKLIKEKVPDISLYFFSDDIHWVKQNLSMAKDAEFMSSSNQTALEDFYLMSKCRHMIIANSSFSWWAAWLNNNTGKIVIAPKNWFARSDINTHDLIPRDWTRI
jgi:Glycosyl transferase family 11